MPTISSQLRNLSPSQIQMAEVIEREFLQAGYNSRMVVAAILNAIAESQLNPKAIGDKGRSVGLFQLNVNGAGSGMSVASRQDPVINTRKIIEVVGKSKQLLEAWKRGDGSKELTRLLCIHVERPSDKERKGLSRADSVSRYLPSLSQQFLPPIPSPTNPRSNLPYILAGGGLLVLTLAIVKRVYSSTPRAL